MAAHQRKKRINAASLIACTSREQHRINRKKSRVRQHDLNMRPNISLEWDNKKKSVVSKRGQIGIAQRHLIPFIEPRDHSPSILADVFSVPQEIFELENLAEVLSYEVWQSHLSDKERSFLSQFLPKEPEPDPIVRDLLAGDNFHFGNPFFKWGSSLCFGKLHPDNVLLEGHRLISSKKAYYSHLQKYHNDMIENLQMLKKKWASCEDPGVTVQNIWSSRKHAEQSVPLLKTGFYGTEENLIASPEPCSWVNSEVAYSSDNQNSGMMHGESQRGKGSLNIISDYYSNELTVTAVPEKGEKIHKRNIHNADGAKYMSYVKVSKEQHERVKSSMKHAGTSNQLKSLNTVLGSIDTLNVQPFERFEEEEKKKLNDHWLKLATKDIPESSINWRRRQFQRQQLIRSLGEELGQKLGHWEATPEEEEEEEGFHNKQMQLSGDSEEEILPSTMHEDVEKELTDDLLQEQRDNEEAIREVTTEKRNEREVKSDHIFEHQTQAHTEIIEDKDVPGHASIQDRNEKQIASINKIPGSTSFHQDQHQHQLPISSLNCNPHSNSLELHQQPFSSLNCNPHGNSLELESHGGDAHAKMDEDPPILSQYQGNLNHLEIPVNQGGMLPSACDVWPVDEGRSSYFQSTATNAGYSQELPIRHPQFIQGQEVRILDLETDRQDKDSGKDILHRQPDYISLFSSYSNQDRNELFESFFKSQSSMSYHQRQKHSGLEFQPGNDLMVEAGQFPGHFREQVHLSLPLDPRPKRLNDLYMNPDIQETIYPGGHFAMPRREGFPVNIQDWATANNARGPAPSQPHMNSSELTQNWYTSVNGTRVGWPSFEAAVGVNHSLGSGSNSDQTLFSVLSECHEILPRSGYESVGSAGRLVQAGNYRHIVGGIHSSSNFLQQSANPVNYLSGHDAGAVVKMNNLGLVGIPQQNSGIQESLGKSFLRSWNH